MSTTPTPPNGMVSNTELILRKILGEDVTPLPPNSRVEFYLTQVEEYIERLATGATRPIGETTTPLTDGATTNPITIDGESYTAQINDLVFYQNKEFLFTANGWREVGDLTNLNADMIDDTNTTNKFATAAQLDQINTNKNNISLIKHAANSSIYIQETQPESGSIGDYWISTTGTKIYHLSNNLFDGVLLAGVWDTVDTRTSTDSNAYRSFKLNLPAGTYTISFAVAVNIVRLIKDGTLLENLDENVTSYTVTTTTENDLGFSFRITGTPHTPWDNSNIMLNSGSEPLPYEPYGGTWGLIQ